MKYFIIAGEASGDLHAGQLITALRDADPQAEFRFLGGDCMAKAADSEPLVHYRDMAYMGFVEVFKHLGTILGIMRRTREAIDTWRPNAVILVDYPSFNLKIARHAHQRGIPVFYFISPKVWAWKSWRVRDIKRDVARVFSILPFEKEWYRQHDYEVDYVGNPTVAEMAAASATFVPRPQFLDDNGLDDRPIVALLPGSRVKEVRDNLPTMLEAVATLDGVQPVVAAAPALDDAVYRDAADRARQPLPPLLRDKTFHLVHHARVAAVTSGTATLETAVLGTPQVACYRMNGSRWLYKFYSMLLKGKYVTLPNLIVDAPVIDELLLHQCTVEALATRLSALLADGPERTAMLAGYTTMMSRLGTTDCATTTAQAITQSLALQLP